MTDFTQSWTSSALLNIDLKAQGGDPRLSSGQVHKKNIAYSFAACVIFIR